FFCRSAASRHLPPFPTRRSSDLERVALERLEQGLGAGGRAAAGLDDVLEALNERRVELLLFEEGFRAPGVACPHCGWLGADPGTDRKSTRLNSSHRTISYAVFCL